MNMNKSILIVESDQISAQLLKKYVEKFDFTVKTITSGKKALQLIQQIRFDAIILEWDLPDIEGIDVCKQIRYEHQMPILMISSRTDEFDSILALELGATDYIRKPLGVRELVTRLRVHLNRYNDDLESTKKINEIKIGPFKVDYTSFLIYKNQQPLALTKNEFKLLTFLMSNPKQIITREQLISMLNLSANEKRTVDVHIRRLREKIEEKPSTPKWLKTKSGVGYYFNTEQISRIK